MYELFLPQKKNQTIRDSRIVLQLLLEMMSNAEPFYTGRLHVFLDGHTVPLINKHRPKSLVTYLHEEQQSRGQYSPKESCNFWGIYTENKTCKIESHSTLNLPKQWPQFSSVMEENNVSAEQQILCISFSHHPGSVHQLIITVQEGCQFESFQQSQALSMKGTG